MDWQWHAVACSGNREREAKSLTFISEVLWPNPIWTPGQEDKEKVGNLHSYQSAHGADFSKRHQIIVSSGNSVSELFGKDDRKWDELPSGAEPSKG